MTNEQKQSLAAEAAQSIIQGMTDLIKRNLDRLTVEIKKNGRVTQRQEGQAEILEQMSLFIQGELNEFKSKTQAVCPTCRDTGAHEKNIPGNEDRLEQDVEV